MVLREPRQGLRRVFLVARLCRVEVLPRKSLHCFAVTLYDVTWDKGQDKTILYEDGPRDWLAADVLDGRFLGTNALKSKILRQFQVKL